MAASKAISPRRVAQTAPTEGRKHGQVDTDAGSPPPRSGCIAGSNAGCGLPAGR
jgi:hypothetical protein